MKSFDRNASFLQTMCSFSDTVGKLQEIIKTRSIQEQLTKIDNAIDEILVILLKIKETNIKDKNKII